MEITASLVKQLRDETGAPMGDCRAALIEAQGDFEGAKRILREKGQAAASKRAGRATSEGVVAISGGGQAVGVAVLEAETDFVAKNPDFIAAAQAIADAMLDASEGADPNSVAIEGKTVKDKVEGLVALIRENIQLAKGYKLTTADAFATYVHHDRKYGAVVELSGAGDKAGDIGRKLAIQVVAMRPTYVRKEDISQDVINQEIETETQRAINEGKPENIARNIAQGRVNKEFFQSAVLLEQVYFEDQKKTVGQWLKEQGAGIDVKSFKLLAVGAE